MITTETRYLWVLRNGTGNPTRAITQASEQELIRLLHRNTYIAGREAMRRKKRDRTGKPWCSDARGQGGSPGGDPNRINGGPWLRGSRVEVGQAVRLKSKLAVDGCYWRDIILLQPQSIMAAVFSRIAQLVEQAQKETKGS